MVNIQFWLDNLPASACIYECQWCVLDWLSLFPPTSLSKLGNGLAWLTICNFTGQRLTNTLGLALTAWTVIASNSLYLQLTLFPGCLWWLSYNSLHLMHICYVKSCAPSDTVEASSGGQQERQSFHIFTTMLSFSTVWIRVLNYLCWTILPLDHI